LVQPKDLLTIDTIIVFVHPGHEILNSRFGMHFTRHANSDLLVATIGAGPDYGTNLRGAWYYFKIRNAQLKLICAWRACSCRRKQCSYQWTPWLAIYNPR